MRNSYTSIMFISLTLLLVILFWLDLMVGSVNIAFGDVWDVFTGVDKESVNSKIILNIRLNKAIVAVLAGAALSLSGLQMQTVFRNPLAGPYVLGVSSGASLGVALFILWLPMSGMSVSSFPLGMAGAAWLGSAVILMLVVFLSGKVRDIMAILVLGMMFSSGVSAVVQILQYLSHEDALKTFVIWTMGSLGEVTESQLYILLVAVVAGTALGIVSIKPLNLLLLGEDYARTSGMDIRKSRTMIFISTVLLAGSVTAFCGPIGFIGLAIPHIARLTFGNADHRVTVPATILIGGIIMVGCDIVSKLLVLPINAITALFGIPVIILIVLRIKRFAL